MHYNATYFNEILFKEKKDNCSFHVMQASTVFLTASRVYGVYIYMIRNTMS